VVERLKDPRKRVDANVERGAAGEAEVEEAVRVGDVEPAAGRVEVEREVGCGGA
jgi:hypothetical protein